MSAKQKRSSMLILTKNATGTGKDANVGLARGGKESRRRKRQRPLQTASEVMIARDGCGGFLQLTLIQQRAFVCDSSALADLSLAWSYAPAREFK